MKTATIEELAYLIKQAKTENQPKPIIFLGAGASRTGDIPLAGEIAVEILERYKNNPTIKILKDEEKIYPRLMECLTPFERNKLLKEYVDKAKINVTHLYIAQFVHLGYVDYILTVNFDNLMLRALALFNFFPPIYDMAVLKDLTTTTIKEGAIVFLHGRHDGLWLLNTREELKKVETVIPPIIHSIKNGRPWVFIGYSGTDPIFNHIVNLGRFDNGLYWITLEDNNPCENVCKELFEKPNTNTSLIKGYNSDSFILKLNTELGLPQPTIIDKPFTSLNNSLSNLVDIDDKDYFKGVKERLEIAKKNVYTAISQFEEGNIQEKEKLETETEIDLLKKKIIDKILNEEFKEEEIELLEKEAEKFNVPDIFNSLSNLYNSWGVLLHNTALLKNDELLIYEAIKKYEKATAINPKYDLAFNNWGIALYYLAKLNNDESLYNQCFEKYQKATTINPKYDSAFNTWGNAIYYLAKLKNDESLYNQSFEKYEKATTINPKLDWAFNNWGNAIYDLAKSKNDETLYIQCFEKYEKATTINPKFDSAFNNWGIALNNLAKLKNDESLYNQSFEKYEKATTINPNNDSAFNQWGNTISNLAKLKNDESLYNQSFKKFEKATTINSNNDSAFYNWGAAICDLAKFKKDVSLFEQSILKLKRAVELGASHYNLACAYALIKDKVNALKYLEESLSKKNIEVAYVEKDEDWIEYINDVEIQKLLNKYR